MQLRLPSICQKKKKKKDFHQNELPPKLASVGPNKRFVTNYALINSKYLNNHKS